MLNGVYSAGVVRWTPVTDGLYGRVLVLVGVIKSASKRFSGLQHTNMWEQR